MRSQGSPVKEGIEQDYRLIGFWGMTLAAVGIIVLIVTMVSFVGD